MEFIVRSNLRNTALEEEDKMRMEENMRWLTQNIVDGMSILLETLEAALNELNVVEGGCLKGRHPKLNSHC